jgi:hypothetical protein
MTLDSVQLRELHRGPRRLTMRMLKSRRLSSAGTVTRMVERRNMLGMVWNTLTRNTEEEL